MKLFSRIWRILRINIVLARYNLDELFFQAGWFYPLRFMVYFNPWYWHFKKITSRAVRLRLAIEELGPIFVKAAQIISTRRDLIPEDIAEELAKLQDRVPPFPGDVAKAIIEQALKCKLEDVFSDFEITALASASIAQVHAATLITSEVVVIKVLRPDIKKIIDRDLDLFMMIARLAEKYWKGAKQFKPKELVNEIAQTLYGELDLMREGANASEMRRHFTNSSLLYIPKMHWRYCRTNILVMERIYGIPIHNKEALSDAGINMRRLAERAIEMFFTQVFRDSFFHADLHPGNLFVSTDNLENPQFIAVDFGIVGSLDNKDKRYIAENMVAFFNRDYQRVAELHVVCGWVSPHTRIDQFEAAIRAVSEPIFERPLKDISFGQLLLSLFRVASDFQINIQPQLILLQKTLLSIEGLSRQLSPEFDLWSSSAPYLERWLKKEVGPRAFFKRVRENIPLWSLQFPEIPNLIYEVLSNTKEYHDNRRFSAVKNKHIIENNTFSVKAFFLGVVTALLCVGVYFYR